MCLHGLQRWGPFKRQTGAACGCAAEQVKVRVCRFDVHTDFDLLPPRLNGGPVGAMYKYCAM